MKILSDPPPVVLSFSAHDPCGAAGIQADIESIQHNGAHCVSVITALTAQNTGSFTAILPQDTASFRQQTDLLLADVSIAAFKTGLIGSPLLVSVITEKLRKHVALPVVVDPVLRAGTGTELAGDELVSAIFRQLVPLATIITPNLQEAFLLTGKNDREAAADILLEAGCKAVLITGADESAPTVINSLYEPHSAPVHFQWERLPGTYHGSGCTLASAIAARLACGEDLNTSVTRAQEYTWLSLKHGYQLGQAQYHPDRHYRDRL